MLSHTWWRWLLTDLVNNGEMTMESYFKTSIEFYDTALSYLETWNENNKDVSNVRFFLLNAVPSREKFDTAINLLSSECPVLTINRDELFDEFTYLRTYSLKKSEWFNSTAVTKKWCKVFLHLKENNVPHDNMMKAVGLVMAVRHLWKEYFHIWIISGPKTTLD